MDEDSEFAARRQWPLWIAAIASLIWLGVAGTMLVAALSPGAVAGLAPLLPAAAAVLALAAPLALLWLVADRLRDTGSGNALRTRLMAEHSAFIEQRLDRGALALADLERRLEALIDGLDGVARPVRETQNMLVGALHDLENAAGRFDGVTGATRAAAASLAEATPAASAQVERLTALLTTAEGELRHQLEASGTLLAALAAGAAGAEIQARTTATATSDGLAAIEAAVARAEAAMAAPLADLNGRVDAAFVRTAAAMDTIRDGVHAQTSAMLASVDQARVTLDHIGGEAARQVGERLEAVIEIAARLAPAVEDQAERATTVIDTLSRGFGVLDTKLANSAATGNATLESIAARMTEAREAIHRLGEPIAGTQAALGGVENKLAAVGDLAGDVLGALGDVGRQIPLLDDMTVRLGDLHDRAEGLQAPLSAGGNSLSAAQGLLDAARASLDAAAVELGTQLAAAQAALDAIERKTGDASLAASTQLIDVFGRVRDIAQQTAGTMRDTLGKVVEEARDALADAGTTTARAAFGEPIEAQLAAVEASNDRVAAAAQAAAERVTQRLLALMGSVADVEDRVARIETGFDVRARGSLARRSKALIESLQRSAVEFSGLLALDIEDADWDAYLKGDRSVFTRRVLDRMEGDSARAIGRHFQHDPEFRSQATQYIDEFETLISHVMSDREGQSLSTALLGSHVGRLYLAIANGAGRFED